MMSDRPWFSLIDDDGSPELPSDTLVETKGGYGDDRIVKDYMHSSIGDWMNQPGDPSHWRPIVPDGVLVVWKERNGCCSTV